MSGKIDLSTDTSFWIFWSILTEFGAEGVEGFLGVADLRGVDTFRCVLYVTLTKKWHFREKAIANFAVFLYYSLEIKFVPFLKS